LHHIHLHLRPHHVVVVVRVSVRICVRGEHVVIVIVQVVIVHFFFLFWTSLYSGRREVIAHLIVRATLSAPNWGSSLGSSGTICGWPNTIQKN
jgi:hypothetical protein